MFHDDTLERTTNGRGRVDACTLAELRSLDAGYRFSCDGGATYLFRGSGHHIATLEEVFSQFPAARINIELKSLHRDLIEGVVEWVARFRRSELTLLTAADDAVMATLRAHVAKRGVDVALGASTGEVAAFIASALANRLPPPGVMALQVPVYFAGKPLISQRFIEHAHRHDIEVHAWTVNDVGQMGNLLEQGVDGIVTDFPERLAQVIARHRPV